MAGDRDIAVAFVRALAGSDRTTRVGWEMTSATGVRGLRLLSETRAFRRFLFSEAQPEAARVLTANAERFPGAEVREGDCRSPPDGAPFDYVDLDPYGTPAPFLTGALSAVRDSGVLAVTATDMMVLAGAQPAACVARYGARPVRGRLGPEGGLRILLGYLARNARATGRTIRPLLAYARDHYVRAYIELRDGSAHDELLATVEPDRWEGPWLGDRGPFGPMWLGPLFDAELVGRLVTPEGAARPDEVSTFLSRVRGEATVDRPFYYESNVVCARLGLAAPPSLRSVEEALRARGFRTARTHARPEGFRTDAPRTVVEDVVRRLSPPAQSQKTRVRA